MSALEGQQPGSQQAGRGFEAVPLGQGDTRERARPFGTSSRLGCIAPADAGVGSLVGSKPVPRSLVAYDH